MEQQWPQYETECFYFSPQQALSLLKARFADSNSQEDSINVIHQQLETSKKNIQEECPSKSSIFSSFQGQRSPRVNLTKKIIEELKQIFRVYGGLSQAAKKMCTLKEIANTINIGYSTLRKKYKEFKECSEISYGKKIIDPPKTYARNRLACYLIERSIQEGCQFSAAKELSQFFEEKYGLSYSLQALNRALRFLDVRPSKGKKLGPTRAKDQIEYLSTQELMVNLVKMQRIMLYFGKYHLRIGEKEEIIVLLLASRQGIVFRTKEKLDKPLTEILQEMLKEYHEYFFLNYSDTWYLIINHQDFIQQQDDLLIKRMAQNQFCLQMEHFNPKIVFLPFGKKAAFNPSFHIYEQIAIMISQNQYSPQEAITIIRQWLTSQRENILNIILKTQQSISNRN